MWIIPTLSIGTWLRIAGAVVFTAALGYGWWQHGRAESFKAERDQWKTAQELTLKNYEEYRQKATSALDQLAAARNKALENERKANDKRKEIARAKPADDGACPAVVLDTLDWVRQQP